MEGIIKLSTRLGLAAVGFGVVNETCLYDGKCRVIFSYFVILLGGGC